MSQSIIDELLKQTEGVSAGIDRKLAEIAHLQTIKQLLVSALTMARGEMVEDSGYTGRHPAVQAIDAAIAFARTEPHALARLSADEMAGART